jgi:thiamine biosynthesis lipoprotein
MRADAHERHVRVMGTDAHLIAVGDPTLVDEACVRLDDLERRWSRFRANSEISRLNAHAGEHVIVSPDTFTLVVHAIAAWERTHGLFDPTVLPAVRAAGYDRDFSLVIAHAPTRAPYAAQPAAGCAAIECDASLLAITLPPGVEIDPGGIGKGLAADIVSAELLEAGAHGALVNVGGDARVRGEPPNGRSWDIAIDDPARVDDREALRIGLHDGGIATSSQVLRRWTTVAGEMHHLIDPRTGRPSTSRYATVTAVAGDAWWAEVVAKTVLIGELAPDRMAHLDAYVLTITNTGEISCDPELLVTGA